MAGYLALLVTTFVLTGLFAVVVASADIEEIKQNWSERRCEIPVVVAGGMFKPKDDKRSSTEFAQDNFKYCSEKIAADVIKIAFAPLYAIMGQQMNAQSTMTGPLNSIRAMIAEGVKSFSNIFDQQYRQYKSIFVQVTKTWHHIRFAMGRIQAIVISLVYMGLTATALLQNTMKLIVNVVLIFIGIMAAMILLIWFGIIPFIFIIVTVLSILIAADVETDGWISGGGGGLGGVFCIDPKTNIKMADGSIKKIVELKCGDKLFSSNGENIVTGILTVDSSAETIVEIDGVCMSTCHRILHKDQWILAKDHPSAKPSKQLPYLICLNTSEHVVPAVCDSGLLMLGDWEEITTEAGRKQWINWVSQVINPSCGIRINNYPTNVPLCSPDVIVHTPTGPISLMNVTIGDSVLCQNAYTKVIGIYIGQLKSKTEFNTPDWISDGIWKKTNGIWTHFIDGIRTENTDPEPNTVYLYGICLVTQDGTFYIQGSKGIYLLRDFTEVGVENIGKSYSWIHSTINKKSIT